MNPSEHFKANGMRPMRIIRSPSTIWLSEAGDEIPAMTLRSSTAPGAPSLVLWWGRRRAGCFVFRSNTQTTTN